MGTMSEHFVQYIVCYLCVWYMQKAQNYENMEHNTENNITSLLKGQGFKKFYDQSDQSKLKLD